MRLFERICKNMSSRRQYLPNGFKKANLFLTQVEDLLLEDQQEMQDLLEGKLLLTLTEVGEDTEGELFLEKMPQRLIVLLLMPQGGLPKT